MSERENGEMRALQPRAPGEQVAETLFAERAPQLHVLVAITNFRKEDRGHSAAVHSLQARNSDYEWAYRAVGRT
jgi:hypothetical protein